jgi:hypothetical protein
MMDSDDRSRHACAVYWWLTHNHGGQFSREYSLLSRIGDIYKPGARERGPDDDSQDIYDDMTVDQAEKIVDELEGP